MRQTTMDRWIEAAEARRISQIAQENWAPPPPPTPLPNLLMTKLRSMVRAPNLTPVTDPRRVTRSVA